MELTHFQIFLRTLLNITLIVSFSVLYDIFLVNFRKFLAKHFRRGADFINMGTILGVMHHELSHALFAFLTGAKISNIDFFKPDENSGTLGSVSFYTRGPSWLQKIQSAVSSIAPLVMGFVSVLYLLNCVIPAVSKNIILVILFGYLAVSIFLHTSLSVQDVKTMGFGIVYFILILTAIFFIFNINIFRLIDPRYVRPVLVVIFKIKHLFIK